MERIRYLAYDAYTKRGFFQTLSVCSTQYQAPTHPATPTHTAAIEHPDSAAPTHIHSNIQAYRPNKIYTPSPVTVRHDGGPYALQGLYGYALWVRHIGPNRVRLRMKRRTRSHDWFYGTVEAALTITLDI